MNQGKIIEYIDQGSLICTLCLQDRGSRLHLLTLTNRDVNLSPKRSLLISKSSINTEGPRAKLLNRLKQKEELRKGLMGEVQVKELWELVRDEQDSFDYEYLAQLCFGETVTDDHISALVRALFEDKLYFKMKDGRFLPNSEYRIDEIVRQREEEALREKNLRQGSAWLKEVLENKLVQPPPCKGDIINLLVELVLYGSDAPDFRYGKDLFSRAGIPDIGEARNLLVRLGIWEEDENLDLLRFEIRTSFSEKQIQEADQLARAEAEMTYLEDLRHLPIITIDGPLTRDFDDALSIEIVDDTIHLGIHIADVAGVIPEVSLLEREASQRGSSLYLPCSQIPMFPHNLSQDILSLKEGRDCPAISLISSFNKKGALLDHRFVPSLIKVRRQLTYDQVNELYTQKGPLEEMYKLSQLMQQKRIDQGALILSLPDISIKIDPDSSISLELIEQQTPSRTIVAEFMIFYNWMIARFCRDNKIPILYRGQEEPSKRLPVDEADYIFFVFKQRRKLSPLMINTEPRPHTGLGLDVYTNASSPIRRYLDLVLQRQVRNFLLNRTPTYNEEELEQIRISTGSVLKDLQMVKRNRTRYWIQKYLLRHIGERFTALVLYPMKNRYRILLTDFLLVVEMKRQNGQDFSEGQRIVVKIKNSDPWNDILKVEYIENS